MLLIRSIISDMKVLKKDCLRYTAAYIGLTIISNALSLIQSKDTVITPYLNFLPFFLSILQMILVIYFQQIYIKQKIGNLIFNPVFTVILHIYFIYFLQMIIFIIPVAALNGLSAVLVPKTLQENQYIVFIRKGLFCILLGWWLTRLIFVSTILVYKKESIKMKHIVAESKAIFKKNYFIVLPFFLILYLSALYTAYKILNDGAPQAVSIPSSVHLILLTCSGYLSSLIYCRLVIDYQLEMASRYLSDKNTPIG